MEESSIDRKPVRASQEPLEKRVVELYKRGLPVREIQRITRIRSMAKIYRILKKNIQLRKKKRKKWKPSEEEIRKLCEMKENGVSIYRISRYFDRSPSTIWRYARKYCTHST